MQTQNHIQPANRIGTVEEYYFSIKLKELEKLRQQGKPIINMGIGNPDLPPAPDVLAELNKQSSVENNHGYQSYVGIPELREAMSRWYNKHYNVEVNSNTEILPLMGSKEGIMHITMAFVNPGDSVLVPNPGYPTYASASKIAEAKLLHYDLDEHNNWLPNIEELEKQDLSKVKLMWINYPNMPTGANADKAFFEKIIAFGKKHGIVIINDNPYSFILNDNPQSIMSLKGAKDIAIELNSLSKSHNMAGWRVGMAVSNPTFIQYILRVKSNMDSGMFKPLQLAAVKALELDTDWYNTVNSEYKKRRVLVHEIMDLLNCEYDINQTGMFVWARIPDNYKDSGQLSDEILYGCDVFITPGFIFGDKGKRYIRISLCTNQTVLQEAKQRINALKTK
ncbi:aminotransferase class I/II-fold pyridoxal phosphate-dependent enzyme [Carboxylicivirga sp. A043]|uniref:pyridoxal phosphate-dependent aminotransferase n=1 Tax=Carboxylicivirga litoralis TaxID=2816963 RepID=UPI0021CB5A22|nr:aminotransferase class I/II-fold pyridoxal phosphate-dependent enzyme [Carboxylicivirga sp. A043]MCU4156241.1 aminotransferase class I/II-fold pyridoxal phosphate-dependent enzyme [Carboxylicivirga sp. A043]